MLKRTVIVITLVFLPATLLRAQGILPSIGLYLDSFTGLSGKGGFIYAFSSLAEEEDSSFGLYADYEFGSQASKITLGPAYATGLTISRVGISFAKKDSQNYVGVEWQQFIMFFSLKLGIYEEPDSGDKFATLGFGLGY